MNQIMQSYYPIFEMYQSLRQQMMDLLSDEDLTFKLAGNPTLGAMCREMGEVEQAYIDSFSTFKIDFSYRHPEANKMESSVAALAAWYGELDEGLKTAVSTLTDDDISNKIIERGHNFMLPPNIHLTVYNEALLIFYGRASVYLKAMGKTLPEQWQQWIG